MPQRKHRPIPALSVFFAAFSSFAFLFFLPFLLSCAPSQETSKESSIPSSMSADSERETALLNVVFEEDGHYRLPQYLYQVPRGGDLVVEMEVASDYALTGLDYAQSSFEMLPTGKTKVSLFNLRYATRVRFAFDLLESTFVYDLAGGSFLSGEGETYRLPASTAYHARPNLDVGVDRIAKKGHTLIGWQDESGAEIGLGSRYTLPKGNEIRLRALWEPWNSSRDFMYRLEEGKAYVMGFRGEDTAEVVVPSTLGGCPVTRICAGFFSDCAIRKLVLPLSLDAIDPQAFYHCSIGDLYLYDVLHKVEGDSFIHSTVERLHILAAHPSRGLALDPNTQFAEDMDRLILRKDKKKIVFFAGCSGSYSINSKTLEERYGSEYEICNMAVLGGTNGTAMMEAILPYLGPGDIFIHAPEEMSEYQLYSNLAADHRLFLLFEGNYDLLRLVDINIIPNFWTSLAEYVALMDERADEETFAARTDAYNEYGDYIYARPNSPDDADFGIQGVFVAPFVTVESGQRMDAYYKTAKSKGAEVLFTYAPVNENAVNRIDPLRNHRDSFLAALFARVKEPTYISDINESILPGRYFYDQDYHVTEEGREVRTAVLVKDLDKYFNR